MNVSCVGHVPSSDADYASSKARRRCSSTLEVARRSVERGTADHETFILMSNHKSLYDIPLLIESFRARCGW